MKSCKPSQMFPCPTRAPLAAFFFMALAMSSIVVPLWAGTEPLLREVGVDPASTLVKGDPIWMGGGEFRQSWRLFDLGGPMGLGFSLIYGPDLRLKSPVNDGRCQFPPWYSIMAFNSDSILRIVLFEDRRQEPYKCYANVFLAEDTLVFELDETGAFKAIGSRPFELKKQGDLYCLKDPYGQRVLFFRNRPLDMDWGPFWIGGAGVVLEIRDRNGNSLTYTYNPDNLPTRIADGLGRHINFLYAEDPKIDNRNLLSVTDHTGRAVSFQYAPCIEGKSTRLESFTAVDGRTTRFLYEMAGTNDCWLVEKIQLPEGNSHIDQDWVYSSFVPFLARQRDAFGNETSLAQSSDPQGLSTVTTSEPGGAQTTFLHQDKRHPTGLTDAEGKSLQIGYDGAWRPISLKDREGGTSSFSYETASGFPNLLTDAVGSNWTVTYEARDQSFELPGAREEAVTFTFHLPTCYQGPAGPCRQLEYDAHGNAVSHTDQAGRTWTATHDASGKALSETSPLGATTTFSYFQDASLAGVDGPDSDPVGFEYDSHGYLKRISRGANSSVEIGRDIAGRVTYYEDEEDRIWSYQCDPNGNLEIITDPMRATSLLDHDQMDRTSKVTDRTGGIWERTFDNRGNLASVKDPTGLVASFGYDSLGRMKSVTTGGETWSQSYDAEGVPISQTTPLGLKTEFTSDALGHAISVKLPDGHSTLFARDNWGRVTKVTDPLGRMMEYTYDPTGLLTGVTGPGAISASFAYNGAGDFVGFTDPGGSLWVLATNSMGRKTFMRDPLGRVCNFAYDGGGYLSGITYPGGETLAITRDASRRTMRRAYSSGPDIQYLYDAMGRLASTNGIKLERDAEGRITSTTDGYSALGASYDAAGRLAGLNYGAFSVSYAYGPTTGLPVSVTDSLTGTEVTFAWDKDGRLVGIGRPNGVDTAIAWDLASRISGIRHGNLLDINYARDAAGQVTGVSVAGGPDASDNLRYSSDKFDYDRASQPTGDGFSSDSRGRATLFGGKSVAWDGASRAVSADGVTYEYNGASQPVRREDAQGDRKYQYHHALPGSPLVRERDAAAETASRYFVFDPMGNLLYGIDAADGNAVLHYHFDAMGSTLMLTNSSGEATDRYAYDPFGVLLGHQGTSDQPFTFNGQRGVRREDSEGRLYRMGLRLYDALSARFLSKDPLWPHLKEARSLNPYQFAFGNPLTFSDPAGTDPEWVSSTGYKISYVQGSERYRQGTYYWRVDEVSDSSMATATGLAEPEEPAREGLFYYQRFLDGIPSSQPTQADERAASRGLFYYQRFLDDGPTQSSAQQNSTSERPARTGLFYMHRFLDDTPAQSGAREAVAKVQGIWINVPLAGFRQFVPGGKIRERQGDFDILRENYRTITELWDPATGRWESLDFESQGGGASEGLGPAEGLVDHRWTGFWGS